MRYCGIELKSNEARIVSIELRDDDYFFLSPEIKKIKLSDPKSHAAALSFRADFNAYFREYGFTKIGIKERGRKGKFAGGADSFKMEGILQSIEQPIEVIHTNTIKSNIKDKELKSSKVNAYQEEALKVAVSFI